MELAARLHGNLLGGGVTLSNRDFCVTLEAYDHVDMGKTKGEHVVKVLKCLVLVAMVHVACAALPYIPLDESGEWRMSLNGTWRFALDGAEKEFYKPGYDDGSWDVISVPGNWEVEGFEAPRYRGSGESVGLYRRTFEVPSRWDGRRVFIRFEGVLFGFEFWVNGRHAGSFESAFNRSEFDITDYIELGKSNDLAVRVYHKFKGSDFDTNDAWALSGIYRDVELFAVPNVHVNDITVVTGLNRDLSAATVDCRISVESFSGKEGRAGVISGTLLDPGGSVVLAFEEEATLESPVDIRIEVPNPMLWNAETPHLYELKIRLKGADGDRHNFRRKVGIRKITADGDVLKLNGQPIKIRGVNHHDIHPDVGRAMRKEHYRQDVELMKRGNINTVRTSHYPPHPFLLDLCDEYGIYVIDEVPFGGGDKYLEDPGYLEVLLARADATVGRDKNHPSVIIWSVGNENPITPVVVKTADRVKELDPTRLTLLPGAQSSEGKTAKGEDLTEFAEKTKFIFNLPDSIDIAAPHYPYVVEIPGRDRKINLTDLALDRSIRRPVVCTEYNHSLGTAFEGLKDHWELIEQYERLAGACIWHFQDQGLKRTIEKDRPLLTLKKDRLLAGDVKDAISMDVRLDANTVLDSHGGSGTDGIVYADRFPQSDYWLTRKVYSQVVIPRDEVKVAAGRLAIKLDILNRYDFTNLSKLKGVWALYADNRKVDTGKVSVDVPPHEKGKILVKTKLTEAMLDRDLRLSFSFTDFNGRAVYEHVVRLVPVTGRVDFMKRLEKDAGKPKQDLKPSRTGGVTKITSGTIEVEVDGKNGQLVIRSSKTGEMLLEGPVVRVGRDAAMAEWRNYPRYDIKFWEDSLLENPRGAEQKVRTLDGGTVEIEWTAVYPREDPGKTGQSISADIRLTISPHGWIDVAYELVPNGADDFFLELGLAFILPQDRNKLTWLGDGPYSSYPGQREANERGVWHIEPLPLENPEGRYYKGNRANVDLAAITNAKGEGIGVLCDQGTISLEVTGSSIVFSHILRVAGKGNKTGGMLTLLPVPAEEVKSVKASLRIVPLKSGKWPKLFANVLGKEFKRK